MGLESVQLLVFVLQLLFNLVGDLELAVTLKKRGKMQHFMLFCNAYACRVSAF